MKQGRQLYPTAFNPLLITPNRPLPKQIAVIGAGTIGPDIGYYLKSALPGIMLYLVDIAEKPLISAEKRISGYVQKAIDKRKMKAEVAEKVRANIFFTSDYNQIKDCDLVIEAATEDIPLKQRIFDLVESIVSEKAIITSNTSSIPADRLFLNMKHPERTTVTHFFAPAWRSLPVEVIHWESVSPEVLDYLFWFFARTGKAPIITDNAICFVLDRIFDNWCNEAAYLLDCATASQVDKVVEAFVYAGPFFVLNMANGNPIIIETNSLQMEEGPHYLPAPILASVDRWQTHRPGTEVDVPEAATQLIRDRMTGILFSQSFDIIDRGIGTPEDLNFGCQAALGFRKGPLDIMRDLGASETDRIMKNFTQDRPGFPVAKGDFETYQDFYRHLLIDKIDGVKIIAIRRPQAMNALNDEVMNELLSVFQTFEDNPDIEGFVITGYGLNAFSAGADIGKFPKMLGDRAASIQYAKDCAAVQLHMDGMKKPVVAALNGLAMGGGLELAIRCHEMLALPNVILQFPEINLGILPGIGGCIIPYRKWPQGAFVFHEMITRGKPLFAKEATDIGMINRIGENYIDLIQQAVLAVKKLKGNLVPISEHQVVLTEIVLPEPSATGQLTLSPEAVSITAQTIRAGAACNRLADALEAGYNGFGDIACTEAAKEGISAFLEKRKPIYLK
ncbi:MAG: enoyl-CoA hydratase/isomerase family protein [Deltaproteobacteria bacterium]|nr:enoyl-CoA hydratase/isomerase family protein [Deltaproteobacteria bacterium]